MNEPKRHHYIPQFILRNFCDDHQRLYYYDKCRGTVEKRKTSEVFMAYNLYRDEVNNSEDPVRIEKDFSIFEREIAEILNDRFLKDNEIVISAEEDEKIKLFFALMGFRSKRTSGVFGENASARTREGYSAYLDNKNLQDMWKRNLGHLATCRSLQDVITSPVIDDPMKAFMIRDAGGPFLRYISIADCREPNEFVIGDSYPVVIVGGLTIGLEVELYSVYPISPKRVLLLTCPAALEAPNHIRGLRECIVTKPFKIDDSHTKLKVRKVYEEETNFLNNWIIKNSSDGVAYRSEETGSYLLSFLRQQE